MRKLTLLLLMPLFILTGCHHRATDFPKGCGHSGYHYAKELLILHTERTQKPELFLLHNYSRHKIFINHYLWRDPGASAGWSSVISAGKWSAIVLNQTRFPMLCKRMGYNYQPVNCAKIIAICQYANINVRFQRLKNSSFWVAENIKLAQLIRRLAKVFRIRLVHP